MSPNDNTKIIILDDGQITTIDSVDSDLCQFKWQARKGKKTYYASRTSRAGMIGRKQRYIALHRVILSRILERELLPNEEVDHKDCNGLNNHRGNLRLATASQNSFNRRQRSDNTSGYKGVSQRKKDNKWVAYIFVEGKQTYLGSFDTPQEAHKAYCEAAIKYHGEFARFE